MIGCAWNLVAHIFRSPYSLMKNHPHLCTSSRSKTLDKKIQLGNRQNTIARDSIFILIEKNPDRKIPFLVFDLRFSISHKIGP